MKDKKGFRLPLIVVIVLGVIGIALLGVAFGASVTYHKANCAAVKFVNENCFFEETEPLVGIPDFGVRVKNDGNS